MPWSIRPRDGLLVWLSPGAKTQGDYGLRLLAEANSPAYDHVELALEPGSDQVWDWIGAPQTGDSGAPRASWHFELAASQKGWQTLTCPVEGKAMDFSNVRAIGLRVARNKQRAKVLYLDALTVHGRFR